MLPHNRRVSTKLFTEILEHGTTYHASHMYLRLHAEKNEEVSRFSVVVSKKVEKRAVDRNLLKRRLAAVLHRYIKDIPKGYRGVFFIKKGFSTLSPEHYEQELQELIEKALK